MNKSFGGSQYRGGRQVIAMKPVADAEKLKPGWRTGPIGGMKFDNSLVAVRN